MNINIRNNQHNLPQDMPLNASLYVGRIWQCFSPLLQGGGGISPQIPSKKFPPRVGGGFAPRSLSKNSLLRGISPRFLPKNPPLWAGNMLTCSKHLSNYSPPAAGWKHNIILEMYINWNGLLLGPQNVFPPPIYFEKKKRWNMGYA